MTNMQIVNNVISRLEALLSVEEYRQRHIDEIRVICMDILDNEVGSESFRLTFVDVFSFSSPHPRKNLTQDEIKFGIEDVIGFLQAAKPTLNLPS